MLQDLLFRFLFRTRLALMCKLDTMVTDYGDDEHTDLNHDDDDDNAYG